MQIISSGRRWIKLQRANWVPPRTTPSLVMLLDARGADIALGNRKKKSGWTPLLIAQGYRQGNFRPIAAMEAVISKVMRAHGIESPPAPTRSQ